MKIIVPDEKKDNLDITNCVNFKWFSDHGCEKVSNTSKRVSIHLTPY